MTTPKPYNLESLKETRAAEEARATREAADRAYVLKEVPFADQQTLRRQAIQAQPAGALRRSAQTMDTFHPWMASAIRLLHESEQDDLGRELGL